MFKRVIMILALALILAGLSAKIKFLDFENPGNRRILKNEDGNYWYYRSKPEKSMTLNVDGISEIELRSFAIEELRKPRVIIIMEDEETTYDLELKERLNGFYIYKPVDITIPESIKSIEVLCYQRSIYFRPFYSVATPPKQNVQKLPNLQLKAHGGVMIISHNSTDSDYHVFNPSQSLKFTLNNARNGIVYVRARLLDRSVPVFELYQDGKLVETYEFSLKRTTKYEAVGIKYLSVGKKIVLPENDGSANYELRAKSDHLFFGRPLVLSSK
jgi:hypothetical protein